MLRCSRNQIIRFVEKHRDIVYMITSVPMFVPRTTDNDDVTSEEDDDDDHIPNRDRLQEFMCVFSPATVCYERMLQTLARYNIPPTFINNN